MAIQLLTSEITQHQQSHLYKQYYATHNETKWKRIIASTEPIIEQHPTELTITRCHYSVLKSNLQMSKVHVQKW